MRLENAPVTMPAACSRRAVSSALALLLFTCVAVSPLAATLVRAQSPDRPPRMMVRVPLAPTPVPGDGGVHLVYELHVTNLDPEGREVTLKRVRAVANNGATLLRYEDSTLHENLRRPGTDLADTDKARIAGGMLAVVYMWVTVDSLEAVPVLVHHYLTIEHENEDGVTITNVLEGSPTALQGEAVVIGPPLRGGNWRAGGISNRSAHRRDLMATGGAIQQRFAIDYVQVDEFGQRRSGDRFRNESYYSYGADVLAVADAVVVAVHDSMPDTVPGLGRFSIIPGNYVDLDLGDGRYAVYVHLQPGSVRVNAGDRVRRGQVLGRVGNSGTIGSFAHLHFHLSDAPWPPSFRSRLEASVGEGVPYVHESFEVVAGCACTGAECSVRAAERRELEMPLRNVVIRFPGEADRSGREHTATEVGANRREAICRAMEARYLTRGNVHRIPEAIRAYAEAQALDSTLTIPANYWASLCRIGSLWEHAAQVMPACEQAVTLEPESIFLIYRGMARALTGDLAGAIADLETYVAWERRERESVRARLQGWLDTLRAGENPFTPEVLARLRN